MSLICSLIQAHTSHSSCQIYVCVNWAWFYLRPSIFSNSTNCVFNPTNLESLKSCKDNALEKAEFFERQISKSSKDRDHILEQNKLQIKENELKIQVMQYENDKLSQKLKSQNQVILFINKSEIRKVSGWVGRLQKTSGLRNWADAQTPFDWIWECEELPSTRNWMSSSKD